MTPKEIVLAVADETAKVHVDWFLEIIRPLLESHFRHGFKHGVEYVASVVEIKEVDKL